MSLFTPHRSGNDLRTRARPPTEAELAEIPWLQRLTPVERQRADRLAEMAPHALPLRIERGHVAISVKHRLTFLPGQHSGHDLDRPPSQNR